MAAESSPDAALLAAARAGDEAAARTAIEAGASPACVADDGATPLHAAAEGGHAAVLEVLLGQEGGKLLDVNARDARGRTPLHAAVGACAHAYWPREALLLLLRRGADAGVHVTGTRGGSTPLHAACEANDTEFVAAALVACPSAVHARGERDFSLLHAAARGGAADCITLLLDGGADVAAAHGRCDGWTALHVAACVHSEACITTLLARGADLRAQDTFGDMAVDKWLWGGPGADVIACVTSLSVRSRDKLAPLLAEATKPGVEPSAGDMAQRLVAPLAEDMVYAGMHAAGAGHTGVLLALLDGGLAASACDRRPGERGTPLLMLAAGGGHVAAVKLLLERGADAGAANVNGVTCLHVAADAGLCDVLHVLLHAGAPADAADKDGETPAYWAAFAGQTAALTLLLDHGASIGKAADTGATPLDVAMRCEREDVVELLIERGATPSEASKRRPVVQQQQRGWLAFGWSTAGCQPDAAKSCMVAWLSGLREGRLWVCRGCL
jgi:ankyrin repeat protein